MDGDRGDKVAFTALLALVWLASAWLALRQLPNLTGVERTFFLNRVILCLIVAGVFIAYHVWRSFKPGHWVLRDHGSFEYAPTIDLPNHWSFNMSRYQQIVQERLRRKNS